MPKIKINNVSRQDTTNPRNMYKGSGTSGEPTSNSYVRGMRKNLPINAAMLGQDLIGNKMPLTEKDLGDDDIASLRAAARNSGRGAINYNDYPKTTDKNTASSVSAMLKNPSLRMQTTLGQADINKKGASTTLTDKYNFNSRGGKQDDEVDVVAGTISSPYRGLRALGGAFGSKPGEGANVNVNLGNLKRPTKYENDNKVFDKPITMNKIKVKKAASGLQNISTNVRPRDKEDNLNQGISSAAQLAGDAVIPGLGTGIDTVNKVSNAAFKNSDGVYNNKFSQFAAGALNPVEQVSRVGKGVGKLFSGDIKGASKAMIGDQSELTAQIAKQKSDERMLQVNRSYAGDEDTINQAAQRFKKGGVVGSKVIEIEGKKTPEIHTDKNFNIKNLGTIPHSKGGNKVVANEGDIVFNTQNSLSKYNKIANAIADNDMTTLKKEKNKLPEDGNKAQRGLQVKPTNSLTAAQIKKMNDEVNASQNRNRLGIKSGVKNFFTPKPFNVDQRLNPGAPIVSTSNATNIPRVGVTPNNNYSPGRNYVARPDFTVGGGKAANNGKAVNPIVNKAITIPKATPKHGISTYKAVKTPATPSLNSIKPTINNFSSIGDGSDLATKKTPNLLDLTTNQGDANLLSKTSNSIAPSTSSVLGTNNKLGTAMQFAGVANNLFQGIKKEPALDEKYLDPNKLKYTDRSASLRKQSNSVASIANSNAKNLGAGNVGNIRANMNAARVADSGRQEGIDEREQARADLIANQNTEIENQAKQVNLGRRDQYQQIGMANRAAKQSYLDQAASDIGQYGMAKQEEGYLRSRDDKANAAQLAGYNSINGRYQHKSNLDGSTYFENDADSAITKFGTSGGNRKSKKNTTFAKGSKGIKINKMK